MNKNTPNTYVFWVKEFNKILGYTAKLILNGEIQYGCQFYGKMATKLSKKPIFCSEIIRMNKNKS